MAKHDKRINRPTTPEEYEALLKQQQEEERRRKRSQWRMRILIIILIIVIILLLLHRCGGGVFGPTGGLPGGDNSSLPGQSEPLPDGSDNSKPFQPDIDDSAENWTGQKPQDKDDLTSQGQVGIKIPGYPVIEIPKNQKNVQMALLNPEGNPCYFTFTIVLEETNEVLYQSKMVPPGQAITDVTLARGLNAGSYKAVIKITTNALDDGRGMNGANLKTELVAK